MSIINKKQIIVSMLAVAVLVFAGYQYKNKRIPASSLDSAAQWQELVKSDSLEWKIESNVEGDLNQDELKDVVAVLSRPSKDEDEEKSPSLWIFFKQADGSYIVQTKSDGALCMGCGGVIVPTDQIVGEPAITEDGMLEIFYYGGSRHRWDNHVYWRFDKNIGKFVLTKESSGWFDIFAENEQVKEEYSSKEEINYITLSAIQTREREGEFKCNVNPLFAHVTIDTYRFDDKQEPVIVKGSCLEQEQPSSTVEDLYSLKDLGIKAGDFYKQAKKIFEGVGWNAALSTYNNASKINPSLKFPEISDCGSGHDAVCSVKIYKTPNMNLEFYVKQDIDSKQWVIVGNVEEY